MGVVLKVPREQDANEDIRGDCTLLCFGALAASCVGVDVRVCSTMSRRRFRVATLASRLLACFGRARMDCASSYLGSSGSLSAVAMSKVAGGGCADASSYVVKPAGSGLPSDTTDAARS